MNDHAELVKLIIDCSHRLHTAGRQLGTVTARGGAWGLMRSLQEHGPQTIPELARSRPVSRQHIRQLARSLDKRGWVATERNPVHQRSFLLSLTPGGKAAVRAMDRQIEAFASERLEGVPETAIGQTMATLEAFSGKLAEYLSDTLKGSPSRD